MAETYNPTGHVTREKVPLFVVVAPDNCLAPPREAVELASTVRLIGIVEIPGGHFDAYQTCSVATPQPR